MRLGVDTGGTFTDVVADDGQVVKVLVDADRSGCGRAHGRQGERRGATRAARPPTGTTVATNALLEGKGAPVALVTTRGMRDVVEIARQDRPSLYDTSVVRPDPLVPRAWRLEVDGRLDAEGRELEPLGDVPDIPLGAEAVAVCLLHADLVSRHEQQVAEALRAKGHDVSVSSEVSPEVREYERTLTTVVNAGAAPAVPGLPTGSETWPTRCSVHDLSWGPPARGGRR